MCLFCCQLFYVKSFGVFLRFTYLFSYVKKLKGSISAEHGIGQLRKEELIHYKSPEEIKRMKKIKNIFDPKNIMNPGKVI